MDSFLQIGLILAVAMAVAFVMQRAKLPLILGHIVTGILVGPSVLNILRSTDTIAIFSELGITALLFVVGLSLNPRVIHDVGKISLITGIGQILFTVLIGYPLCRFLGLAPLSSAALAIGLTFSSTIIVSTLLADRNDLGTLYGKITVGCLLVQDLVATLILIAVSATGGTGSAADIALSAGMKFLAVAGPLLIVAVVILPRLTRLFAESQEFLFIFSVGWGIGVSALFYGLGLSAEIGALAAGITLASSPYHYEISAKMKLLRDFFIVMFFILLGSQLTFANFSTILWPTVALSLFVLIGNPLIVMILLGLLGYTKKTGFYTGLAVAQISEFSFVLILLMVEKGLVPETLLPLVTSVGITTITLSAIMILNADAIYKRLSPILGIFERRRPKRLSTRHEHAEAFLFGCHRVGADFLPTLKNLRLSTLVVDFDPTVIASLQQRGIRCRYGDAGDNEFIDELDLKHARLVISTIPDEATNRFILEKTMSANPKASVIVTAHTVDEANLLYEDGAAYVIMPHYLGGNRAAMILEKIGPDHKKLETERKRHLKHLAMRAS